MGPSMLITVSLGILLCMAGTTLVNSQRDEPWWHKRPGGHNGRDGPPPGKRSAIRSSLGVRDFIRGEKVWKRVNRQRFDEDY
ncbi:hypothetical protein ACROYT_G034529 [Oculina patagonica]